MTKFRDTDAAEAFIASANSRNTSPEIMKAIAFFARNEAEAESIWSGEGIGRYADLTGIWEHATGNGRISDDDLFWGDRPLAQIMADNA